MKIRFSRKRSSSKDRIIEFPFPQELVEKIVSYIYDPKDLHSCYMTCSWLREAARPHIFYSIKLFHPSKPKERKWTKSLKKGSDLDLLRFAMRFSSQLRPDNLTIPFTPEYVTSLNHFSQLKNLRELRIDGLVVPNFVQNINEYFGHFAPNLRSLTLSAPVGTCRELLYFIKVFENIQDIKLCNPKLTGEHPTSLMLDLNPALSPPRGWLTLQLDVDEKLVGEMIALYGGLHFRHVSFSMVPARVSRTLLEACGETLETLELDETETTIIRHINPILRPKSLKTLKTLRLVAANIEQGRDTPYLLEQLLSASGLSQPQSIDVIIVYNEEYFYKCTHKRSHTSVGRSRAEEGIICERCIWMQVKRFQILDQVHREVRSFRLVLCAEVPGRMERGAIKRLEHEVEEAIKIMDREVIKKARGEATLGGLHLTKASVIYRTPRDS